MKEVRQECGMEDTSSEEDDSTGLCPPPTPEKNPNLWFPTILCDFIIILGEDIVCLLVVGSGQRSRKQLFKSSCPVPSPEPTIPSVVHTFSPKPPLVNGDITGQCSSQLLKYLKNLMEIKTLPHLYCLNETLFHWMMFSFLRAWRWPAD